MNYDFELIFARKRKKLTQQQLADKVGLCRATINKIERGKHRSNFKVMTDIYAAVGLKWCLSDRNPINDIETD